MKDFVSVIKCVMLIAGSLIGAGFVSGKELTSFFSCKLFILPLTLTYVVMFFALRFLLSLSEESGCFQSAIARLGSGGKYVRAWLNVSCFMLSVTMVAAVRSLIYSSDLGFDANLLSCVCSALTLIFCFPLCKKVDKTATFSFVVVPIIIVFIFISIVFFSGKSLFASSDDNMFIVSIKGVLYAFMNLFTASPIIIDSGRGVKNKSGVAFFVCVILFILSFSVLLATSYYKTENADMPLFEVMKRLKMGFFYSICSYFAIVTTLVSSLYPLVKSLSRAVQKILLGAAIYAISFLGLNNIVSYFYPAIGVFGLITVCLLRRVFPVVRQRHTYLRRERTK